MLTGAVDTLVELVLRTATALVGRVVGGRDVVHELAAGWTWSAALWPAAGVLVVLLAVGAWVAFWDD
ncbi:hypothetical protein [Cellulomonas pakistanensis]|uniref:hypothetical protein n=1 Tax=Cellulomonas pakistanensis TaxID=992287 RepID=UPI001941345A|nr:hypothetical protein [Cellulomonas pakistanensis]